MTDWIRVSSGTKWEPVVGYSRALRVGEMVYVAGTTATDSEGNIVGVEDATVQARQALNNIKWALEAVGATLNHVVRTRIFVTDISKWEEVGRVHGEYFKDIRPTTSMVEVSRLINPEMILEIEAEAIVRPLTDKESTATERKRT